MSWSIYCQSTTVNINSLAPSLQRKRNEAWLEKIRSKTFQNTFPVFSERKKELTGTSSMRRLAAMT